MPKRKIIEIDRDKCNGCGLCTKACAEGALVLDKQNKAILAKEIYCDGLGACLDVCPVSALHIVEKEADEYNSTATYEHVLKTRGQAAATQVHGAESAREAPPLPCGCPGTIATHLNPRSSQSSEHPLPISSQERERGPGGWGELTQWPIQLHLVSPYAPYFKECDLLIAADCTAFTLGSFHQYLLKEKKLIIACPKLDDTSEYVDKIAEIIKNNTIFSLTVAIMTVPCCSGIYHIVSEAVGRACKNIAIKKVVIDLEGNIKK